MENPIKTAYRRWMGRRVKKAILGSASTLFRDSEDYYRCITNAPVSRWRRRLRIWRLRPLDKKELLDLCEDWLYDKCQDFDGRLDDCLVRLLSGGDK